MTNTEIMCFLFMAMEWEINVVPSLSKLKHTDNTLEIEFYHRDVEELTPKQLTNILSTYEYLVREHHQEECGKSTVELLEYKYTPNNPIYGTHNFVYNVNTNRRIMNQYSVNSREVGITRLKKEAVYLLHMAFSLQQQEATLLHKGYYDKDKIIIDVYGIPKEDPDTKKLKVKPLSLYDLNEIASICTNLFKNPLRVVQINDDTYHSESFGGLVITGYELKDEKIHVIEAVTGITAVEYPQKNTETIEELCCILHTKPEHIERKFSKISKDVEYLEAKLQRLSNQGK